MKYESYSKESLNKRVAIFIIVFILLFLGAIAFLVFFMAGCSTAPSPIKSTAIRKAEIPGPCDPDPCPPCTNCWTNTVANPVGTNGIWIEIVDFHLQPPPASGPSDYFFVTKAHNLTNGETYQWERTTDIGAGWIPGSLTFVATNTTAIRTNGIPNPDTPTSFRIHQF